MQPVLRDTEPAASQTGDTASRKEAERKQPLRPPARCGRSCVTGEERAVSDRVEGRHARPADAEPVLPVSVELVHSGYVNLAMATSGISVVRRLTVRNESPDDLTDLHVGVEVHDLTGRVLAEPWARSIEVLPAGDHVTYESVAIRPDPGQMVAIDEQRPASLVVEVGDGTATAIRHDPIDVLAYQQWVSRGTLPTLSLELLAAFVLPNHSAVAELLVDARTELQRATSSPSTQGYQSGPDRVDEIAAAIWRAVQGRRIAYSNPPASWDIGQKVRTPDQMLVPGGAGTCLDTTVLFAAALEQAGLHPLLWVVEGHAFVGYWREEHFQLPQTAVLDAGTMANDVDLDRMRLIETTMVTDGGPPTSFADACRAPRRTWVQEQPERVLGVVDIAQARRSGIYPLPARQTDASGQVVVTVYTPAETPVDPSSSPAPVDPTTRSAGAPQRPTAPLRVDRWKNTLLDLSLRNRLINFTAGASATRLLAPDGSLPVVEDLLHGRKSIRLRPADDLDAVYGERGIRSAADLPHDLLMGRLRRDAELFTELDTGPHATRLRGLARKARTLLEESGSANLYLAVGTLAWTVDRRELRSPLLLLPVTLTIGRGGSSHRLTLDEGGDSTPNHCLLEKLRQEHGLEIPGLAEPETDDQGVDVAAVFRAVRETLAAADLPFRVHETLDLGILQFAKFVLWKDLDEHWSRFTGNPLVRHLVHTPTHAFDDERGAPADGDLDGLATTCPVPADSSQLDAVARARAGQTFVLEGPPGTGKSQTITNLLAATMAEGKRVLFVAEKRAALDVVRSRLDAVGLGVLSLDLHDKGSKPAAVRDQLRVALDHQTTVDDDGYRISSDELRASNRSLARYAHALHAPNGAGQSLYGARTAGLARGEGASLPVDPALVTAAGDAVHALGRAMPDLVDAAWHARPRRHHPWGFVRGAPASTSQLVDGVRIADDALAALAAAPPTLRQLLDLADTAAQLHTIADLCRPGRPPLGLLDEVVSPRWERASAELRAAVTRFTQTSRPVMGVAHPGAMDLPLDQLLAESREADAASFLGRKKRQRAVLDHLRPGLVGGPEPELTTLTGLIEALLATRAEVWALRDQGRALPGIQLPDSWNPFLADQRDWPVTQIAALQRFARLIAQTEGAFRDALRAHLNHPSVQDPRWIQPLEHVAAGLGVSIEAAGSAADVEAWRDGAPVLVAWSAAGRERREDVEGRLTRLGHWRSLLELVQPLVTHGSPQTAAAILRGDLEPDDVPAAFERGLAQASIRERQGATELDRFDAAVHERTIRRLGRTSAEVRRHLVDALPRRIVDARSFASDSSRGRIGELRREVNKQRRGLPVRALMARYGDLVTALTPCVLVSPDSLARFFTPDSTPFDLVVFDEASQIRVADAVGALGRAHAAVVVGDSKQMPPTNFGGAGANDDADLELPAGAEEDAVPEDEESILSECVQARVPQSWLSWHYRSQDESLIAFSNHHYYEGRLASFPAPAHDDAGVSLRRIDGRFHRSGPRRAAAHQPDRGAGVVDDVLRRFDAAGRAPSIGIVTFNVQQRDLIDELLRASGNAAVHDALERDDDRSLFVKNLENVQGDERDTILFSIAFSYDDRGRLPLNFGPLNRAGGERRLNVAVTRARREVVVFCSFDPTDLRAEDTSSTGVQHLRAYLELAAGGVRSSGDTARRPAARDRHRDDVAAALRDRDLVVATDVGLSEFRLDLTIATRDDPGKPTLAVLLDGPGWAARRTVGDRDGLPGGRADRGARVVGRRPGVASELDGRPRGRPRRAGAAGDDPAAARAGARSGTRARAAHGARAGRPGHRLPARGARRRRRRPGAHRGGAGRVTHGTTSPSRGRTCSRGVLPALGARGDRGPRRPRSPVRRPLGAGAGQPRARGRDRRRGAGPGRSARARRRAGLRAQPHPTGTGGGDPPPPAVRRPRRRRVRVGGGHRPGLVGPLPPVRRTDDPTPGRDPADRDRQRDARRRRRDRGHGHRGTAPRHARGVRRQAAHAAGERTAHGRPGPRRPWRRRESSLTGGRAGHPPKQRCCSSSRVLPTGAPRG